MQHQCEDTDPRLVSFLPTNYISSETLQRQLQQGILIDPHEAQLFQQGSRDPVCDYVDAESKPSGMK